MRLLLLPLLFLACAPPREYRDGARLPPAEPRTTYAPAGTGLPEYWGRPERKPDVEPNPKPSRLLPPSMEPGIWAAKDPGLSTPPQILGIDLPLPPNASDLSKSLASMCSKMMTEALKDAGVHKEALAWALADRRCLAAYLYALCANMAETDAAAHSGLSDYAAAKAIAATAVSAESLRFRNSACVPPADPRKIEKVQKLLFHIPEPGVH